MADLYPRNPAFVPRRVQDEAVDALMSYFRGGGRGNPILDLATGAGKSYAIAEIIRQILNVSPSSRIGVLTTTRELVQQDYDAIKFVCPRIPAGIVMAGLGKKQFDKQVIVGSIQSLHSALEKSGGFHFILIDEAQFVSFTDQEKTLYIRFLRANLEIVPKSRICGLTATPWRGNKPIFGWEHAVFDEIIYSYGIGQAIKDGVLVPPRTQVSDTRISMAGKKKSATTGDWTEKDLAAVSNDDRINIPAVRDTIEALKTRNSAVVFAASIEHAERVVDLFNQSGQPARMVHGAMDKALRKKNVDDFKAGKYRVVVNVVVLGIGFDHKPLDTVVLLRPMGSSALFLQFLGRGLRISPETGKIDCLLLDYTDTASEMGPIDMIKPPAPPRKKQEREEDDLGSVKECPKCNELIQRNLRICPGCGHEWEVITSGLVLNDEAAEVALLSDQKIPARWFEISGWWPRLHQKQGKPDSLRLEFLSGAKTRANLFLTLGHDYGAREKAVRYWKELGGRMPAPNNAHEGMDRLSEIACPTAIKCTKEGKYERVDAFTYEQIKQGEDA